MMVPHKLDQKVSDEVAGKLWRQFGDTERFLAELRRLGAYKVESIRAIRELAGVDLGEAKRIVHYSHTWADTREGDEALHEALYQAAIEDGWVERQVDEPVKSVA